MYFKASCSLKRAESSAVVFGLQEADGQIMAVIRPLLVLSVGSAAQSCLMIGCKG